MNPEQVNLFEREPDGTQPHRWIHFIGEVKLRDKLVTTDIQSSDRNRKRSHLLHSSPVDIELFIFCRRALAGHEEKFCSEETDTLGPLLFRRKYFTHKIDIAAQRQRVTIFRLCSEGSEFEEFSLKIIIALLPQQIIAEGFR